MHFGAVWVSCLVTGRVWCDVIAFDTRGGVNDRDLIEVFAAMVEHFGLPEALYIDDGKEYGFVTYLDGAMTFDCPRVPWARSPDASSRPCPTRSSKSQIERCGDFESRCAWPATV